MRFYITIMDKINKGLKLILVIFIAVAFVALVAQVFSRFIFQVPITWTEELSRYLLIWITFIGASIAARYQQLIRLEMINSVLPESLKRVVSFAALVITSIFCAFTIYYGLDLIKIVHKQTSPALHIPVSYPYSAILVGCLLIILNSTAAFFDVKKQEDLNL